MTAYKTVEKWDGKICREFLVCPKHGEWLFMEHTPDGSIVRGKHFCVKCRKEQQEAEAWGRSGIPSRFQSKTFDAYEAKLPEQKQALATCMSYARTFSDRLEGGDSLVLMGRPGTGKTHLASAIGGELALSGRSVLFLSMREMVTRVTSTWRGEGSEAQAIQSLTEPDLLIIDEVGGESGSVVEKRIFFSVLNARYESRRSVILITNVNTNGLKDYLGERAYSRLCETASLVLMTWDGYRGKTLKQQTWETV